MSSIEDEEVSIWDQIDLGERDPLLLVYILCSEDSKQMNFGELVEWGIMTGYWNVVFAGSIEEALDWEKDDKADIFMLVHGGTPEAKTLAAASPQTPIAVLGASIFQDFDFSQFPPQVVSSQWAVPRPGELMAGLEGALCKAARELIYQANQPSKIDIVEFTDAFYRQLLRQPNDRFLIHPREFEAVVSDILQRMGHKTFLTPRSGDKGRDIIAHIETKIAPYLMLVECKRYARHRLVGPDPIARIWARLFEDKANLAMVITTSGFQPVAKREAMIKGYQVSLKDGEDFISWIKSLKLR